MGRILGIDYGSQRVGLALSDPLQIIASPYQTLQYQSRKDLLQQLKVIIAEKEVERIVVGLPIGMGGKDTVQTGKAREFKSELERETALPVVFQDERLSSVSAKKDLVKMAVKTGHSKGRVDQAAAAIFLQQFLDTQNR